MPRYYCDYCDTYLTHDSPSVRKQHNAGYKHKANVRSYYQQFEEQQTQSMIDQRIREHLSVAPQGAGMPAWGQPQQSPGMGGGPPMPGGGSSHTRPPVLPLPGQMYPSLGPPMGRPPSAGGMPPMRVSANGGNMYPGPPRPVYGAPDQQRQPQSGGMPGPPGRPGPGYGYTPLPMPPPRGQGQR